MTRLLLLAMCVLCACDDFANFQARPVSPTADAGTVADAASLAPQLRPAHDAGTVEQDSAVQPLPDASAPDAGAVAPPVDAGRAVPVVTMADVDKWLEPTCGYTCHNAAGSGVFGGGNEVALPILLFGAQQVLTSTSTCDDRPYVVPGKPDESYLVLALTAESPCDQHAPVEGFGPVELRLLRDWVSGLAAK